MKRAIIFLAIMIMLAASWPSLALAAPKFFIAHSLTGGVPGSLDNIQTAKISDGDSAYAITGDGDCLAYKAVAASGATENPPAVVQPDDETGDKRWVLQKYIVLNHEGAIRTGKTVSDELRLQAYDTDGGAYSTMLRLIAGTSPSMELLGLEEIDLEAIDDYKADGTRIDRVINNQGLSIEGSGDLSFGPDDGDVLKVYPDGSGINFNSSGTFDAWSQITVINAAATARTINFDSNGLNQPITQNQRGIFVYDGANWIKIYVGS